MKDLNVILGQWGSYETLILLNLCADHQVRAGSRGGPGGGMLTARGW